MDDRFARLMGKLLAVAAAIQWLEKIDGDVHGAASTEQPKDIVLPRLLAEPAEFFSCVAIVYSSEPQDTVSERAGSIPRSSR